MSWLDTVLAVAVGLVVANAARRGFFREGSLLVGLALSFWLAGLLYRQAGPLLPLAGGRQWAVGLYVGTLVVLLVVAAALSSRAVPLVRGGPLRTLDHLAGLFVGILEADVGLGLLATAGERFGLLPIPADGLAARAVLIATSGLNWLAATVPPDFVTLPALG